MASSESWASPVFQPPVLRTRLLEKGENIFCFCRKPAPNWVEWQRPLALHFAMALVSAVIFLATNMYTVMT